MSRSDDISIIIAGGVLDADVGVDLLHCCVDGSDDFYQ
jgi:hypothetical protein